jgi:phosphate:Na+ symporter
MGGVALLLWGLHMVTSGIRRAVGPALRHFLSKSSGTRFAALVAGFGLTVCLQSSTPAALMVNSLASEGAIGLVPALAMMLGANAGVALIVQVLSFNIEAMAPVLFIIGFAAFRFGAGTRVKDLGRVAIGLGLILLALHILIDSLAPAESAPSVRVLLEIVTNNPVLCIIMAAGLTSAARSSVAIVLLIMALAYSHFVTPLASLALVLGANLGSAISPLFEGGDRDDPAAYRVPAGNLLNRLAGIILVTPFLGPIADAWQAFQPDVAKMIAEFHVVFNVALAVAFIGLLDPLAWLLKKVFPARRPSAHPAAHGYLDDTLLDAPSLALADAAPEALHMGFSSAPSGRRVQYAALPFRRRSNFGTEVMLVTSRGTRQWIIPKGWPMKGKAPYAAAAREALEEAGVAGRIGKEPIRSFSHRKFLKEGRVVVCEVQVFPLEVTRQRKIWPEKGKREVQWFSPADAARAVQEPVLGKIIRNLHKKRRVE